MAFVHSLALKYLRQLITKDNLEQNFLNFGGPHSTVDSILATHPESSGLILSVPKIFLEFLDAAEIYQQQCTA